MTDIPTKPSDLSLWMAQYGRPDQMRVVYRQTGNDSSKTVLVFTIHRRDGDQVFECNPEDVGTDAYWGSGPDVCVKIDHARLLDWTTAGRVRLDAWQSFQRTEAKDLAEFARLKAKFGEKV